MFSPFPYSILFLVYSPLLKSIGFVVKLSEKIYESLSSLTSSIAGELNQIVKRYQPGILTLIHQLETIVYDFIVKVSGTNCNLLFPTPSTLSANLSPAY